MGSKTLEDIVVWFVTGSLWFGCFHEVNSPRRDTSHQLQLETSSLLLSADSSDNSIRSVRGNCKDIAEEEEAAETLQDLFIHIQMFISERTFTFSTSRCLLQCLVQTPEETAPDDLHCQRTSQ